MPRPLYCILAVLGLSLTREPLHAQRPTHPAGTILRKIPLTGHAYGVAIDQEARVYVSKVHADELLRVGFGPLSDPQVTSIGYQPPHVAVAPDGKTIFATLQAGRAVVRIDAESGVTLDSLPLGGDGFNLALDPDGEHLVATAAHGWAYRLLRAPLTLVDSAYVGTAPNGVVFDREGRRVYVSSRDAGSVTVLDAHTFRPITRWQPGGQLQRLTLTPDGRTLFVADEGSRGGIVRIDTRDGGFRVVPVEGTPYGLGVTPVGKRLWVLLLDRGEIAILDLPTLQIRATVGIGGRPRNIAFTQSGDRAAVTTESALVLLR